MSMNNTWAISSSISFLTSADMFRTRLGIAATKHVHFCFARREQTQSQMQWGTRTFYSRSHDAVIRVYNHDFTRAYHFTGFLECHGCNLLQSVRRITEQTHNHHELVRSDHAN